MEINRKQIKPGIVVLEMSGSIRMGNDCQRMEQEVDQLLRQNEKRIIFDLSRIYQIDSSGVGRIVVCLSRIKKSGGNLRLAGVTGMVEGVLKLTQIHKIVEMFPTTSKASENFALLDQH